MWRSSGFEEFEDNEDFASDKSQFDALRAELDQLVKDFQRDQAAMSEEDQVAARQKMASKQSDLEYVAKKLQTLQTQNAQRVMQELAPQAQEVLREIIETEQIGLSAAAAGGHSRRSGLQHHGESIGQDESNRHGVSTMPSLGELATLLELELRGDRGAPDPAVGGFGCRYRR